MKFENLLMKLYGLFSFFSIARNGDARDREFKTPLGFNGGGDDGVIPKDLFSFIGIGSFATHADACGSIIGQFGTAKTESVGSIA
jgi:hypothetical protein